MDKFQNKYRISSIRLKNWDYRWPGAYFITICTKNRRHFFGEIIDGKMQLSHVGVIADILWHQIPFHSQNVELDEFVVMPNHIHGIVIIPPVATGHTLPVATGHALPVATGHALSPPIHRFQNIGKNSLSSIVGSYKSAVTKQANRLGFNFKWQTNYYENIIRNEESFQRISNYIKNNPLNWKEDKFL